MKLDLNKLKLPKQVKVMFENLGFAFALGQKLPVSLADWRDVVAGEQRTWQPTECPSVTRLLEGVVCVASIQRGFLYEPSPLLRMPSLPPHQFHVWAAAHK